MPESKTEDLVTRYPGELNEPQKRRLSVTCMYIDNLLCEIEHTLHQAASQSSFPRYIVDLTPVQIGALEGHIRRIRAQLVHTLEWQRLKPKPPEILATRSLATDLAFIDIAVEELKPRHMRGCGPVPEDAVDKLNEVIRDLGTVVKSMDDYVRQEASAPPGQQAEL
jgi:hypothetical protein